MPQKLKLLARTIRNQFQNLPRRVVIMIVFAVIGLATVFVSRAATSSVSIQAEGGTRTPSVGLVSDASASGGSAIRFSNAASVCGKRVQNYTYQVPYGNAVWNQPVCGLATYAKSADYANRLYSWGYVNDGSVPAPNTRIYGFVASSIGLPKPTLFDPEGLSTLFSRNVYYASTANTTTLVQTSVTASNLDGIKSDDGQTPDVFRFLPNTPIPWNTSWRTGEGGDNEIVLLDDRPGPTYGRIYEIAGYKRDLAAVTQCGPFFRDRICTYNVKVGRDMDGNIIDYRSFEGFIDGRGVGLSMFATLTTPEEVVAGEIRHALGMGIPNTATGPICTSAQLGTAAEGSTCGTAVAPASKFEWGGVNSSAERNNIDPAFNSIYTQDKMIPEGMRFALNITDAQIESWITSRGYTGAKAKTARIFAVAFRDYGAMIVDTNGERAGLQLAGAANPTARAQWASVGMDSEEDTQLLQGLVTKTNLYVVAPPTVTCKDGSLSKYFCKWTSARYP